MIPQNPFHQNIVSIYKGAYGSSVGNSGYGESFDNNDKVLGLTTDPANSGIEADLTKYSSKKYYYMVVGNVISDTSWVDIITQVDEGV